MTTCHPLFFSNLLIYNDFSHNLPFNGLYIMRSYDTQRTDDNEPSTPQKLPIVAHISKQSKNVLNSGSENNNKEIIMPLLDPDEYPMNARQIAKLCDVSERTAKRWLSGRTKPPHAARRLIQLTQRQRIIPDAWPGYWRVYDNGRLYTGHSETVTRSQIDNLSFILRNYKAAD